MCFVVSKQSEETYITEPLGHPVMETYTLEFIFSLGLDNLGNASLSEINLSLP